MSNARRRAHPWAVRLYETIDRRQDHLGANALETRDAASMIARRALVPLDAHGQLSEGGPLTALDLTVLLDLRAASPELQLDGGAEEIWTVEVADTRRGANVPPLFWELARRARTGEVRLVVRRASKREVVATSTVRLTPGALTISQNASYRQAAELVLRRLRGMNARDTSTGAPEAAAHTSTGSLLTPATPRNGEANLAAVSLAMTRVGRAVRNAVAARTRRSQWILALRPLTERSVPGNVDGFTPVFPPPDLSYADPFLVADGERTFLFFEQFPVDPPGKGVIAVMDVDRNGAVSSPRTVLERDYHLSYPLVFRDGSSWWMIPETSSNNSIELYRARQFPDEWELDRVLFADISARDATLLRRDGRYWLFATVAGPAGGQHSELSLFVSDALTGPWRPHPRNPIVSDVRWARPAGAIFEHDGRLIRPAQDCSERYGGAVVFREILTLDEREYHEVAFAVQEPTWWRGLRATHTYNRAGALEVTDGERVIRATGRRRRSHT